MFSCVMNKYNSILAKHPNVKLEHIKIALKEECDIRNSPIIQELYDAVSINFNRSEEVEDIIQRMIVMRFFPTMAVSEYRLFLQYYREKLKDDTFFMKYNIMVDCPQSIGVLDHKTTDIQLYDIGLRKTNLNQLIQPSKKTIMLASSST